METALAGTAAGSPDALAVRRLSFHGTPGALLSIVATNALFTLLTLGAYSFWGRCRLRRYVWNETEIDGDRFVFHGNGWELFTAFVRVVGLFAVPLVAINLAPLFLGRSRLGRVTDLAATVLTYGAVFLLTVVGTVGSRRYRLSRTSWRGIRYSFRGTVREFLILMLGGGLLSVVSLGFYTPVFAVERQHFMVIHSYLGNRPFGFDGEGGAVLRAYVIALVLTVPTLGLSWLWYAAWKHRYVWAHTSFDTARFRPTFTVGGLIRLWVVNTLLMIVTLGLGFAWVKARTARFLCAHLVLEGPVDVPAILQEAESAPATGEAVASFFDIDVDVG
jgi:uncharacterized membrane protein YjgN (DUF898 family)